MLPLKSKRLNVPVQRQLCAASGRVCATAACATTGCICCTEDRLPLDVSVIQKTMLPLDMSVLQQPCAASVRVCFIAACAAPVHVSLQRSLYSSKIDMSKVSRAAAGQTRPEAA